MPDTLNRTRANHVSMTPQQCMLASYVYFTVKVLPLFRN